MNVDVEEQQEEESAAVAEHETMFSLEKENPTLCCGSETSEN